MRFHRSLPCAAVAVLLSLSLTGPLPAQGAPLTLTGIAYGQPGVGKNTLHATLTNETGDAVLAVLDVRTEPGLWLLGNWQRRWAFELAPGERRDIEVAYAFERMSPAARLRVRAGPGHRDRDGHLRFDDVVFQESYAVGESNPAALDVDRYFERVRRGPIEVYAWEGAYPPTLLNEIAAERLDAVREVGTLLGVAPPERVRLVLYADEPTKIEQMGHMGLGYASGTTIVEVLNDSVRLDPYHEVAHIVAAPLGALPAALDEGFATYVSERLGGEALALLGAPGRTVHQAACTHVEAGEAFPLDSLFALPDIGSPASRPYVSYPQAASVMKHLADRHGDARFRAFMRAVGGGEGPELARVRAALDRELGTTVPEVEAAWRAEVREACGAGP